MRNRVFLISCFMLSSGKVRPAAFMPSSSVAYFSDKEEVSALETQATEFPKELLKSPKELLEDG